MALQTQQTPITICNSVITKLGSKTITSFEENSKEANLCREQYFKIKRALLYEHPWSFALREKHLLRSSEAPVFGYSFAYLLPADKVRVIKTSLDGEECDGTYTGTSTDAIYKVLGNKLYTSRDEVSIVYVSEDTDEELFSAGFAELFSRRLAMELCYPLTSDLDLLRLYVGLYDSYAQLIRSFNAQETQVDSRLGNNGLGEFVTARF